MLVNMLLLLLMLMPYYRVEENFQLITTCVFLCFSLKAYFVVVQSVSNIKLIPFNILKQQSWLVYNIKYTIYIETFYMPANQMNFAYNLILCSPSLSCSYFFKQFDKWWAREFHSNVLTISFSFHFIFWLVFVQKKFIWYEMNL